MRLALLTALLISSGASSLAYACAGAVPVDVLFSPGNAALDPTERSKLETAIRKAGTGTGVAGLRVAFAVYSQDREADNPSEVDRLTQRRAEVLRDSLLTLGLEASAIAAVRGTPSAMPGSAGGGGLAEVQIAFACQGSS